MKINVILKECTYLFSKTQNLSPSVINLTQPKH